MVSLDSEIVEFKINDIENNLKIIETIKSPLIFLSSLYKPNNFLGVKVEGQVVGFLGYSILNNPRDLVVHGILTASKFQRKGLANKILSFAEKIARERNCLGILLKDVENPDLNLYEGYQHSGFTDLYKSLR